MVIPVCERLKTLDGVLVDSVEVAILLKIRSGSQVSTVPPQLA